MIIEVVLYLQKVEGGKFDVEPTIFSSIEEANQFAGYAMDELQYHAFQVVEKVKFDI